MAEHRILLNRAGDRFTVTVDPVPCGDTLAHGFGTRRAAIGYANDLRVTCGWPVVDLTRAGVA